jgi:uncharacterized protein (TIGR00645 family)
MQKINIITPIERSIFAIRWLLIPLYVGLVAALGLYIAHFVHEVFDMFVQFQTNYAEQNILMLFILELVDMTMISQLVVMTIQGGYAIFIRPFDYGHDNGLPQWLKHGLGTSEQKIKMGMSIIGVMIVHFLRDFIMQHGEVTDHEIYMRLLLLGGVIVATFSFCFFNLLMHHPMLSQHKNEGSASQDKDSHHA